MRSTENMSYTPRLLRVGEGVWTMPKIEKKKNPFVCGGAPQRSECREGLSGCFRGLPINAVQRQFTLGVN